MVASIPEFILLLISMQDIKTHAYLRNTVLCLCTATELTYVRYFVM
jgi:hypothetical protein